MPYKDPDSPAAVATRLRGSRTYYASHKEQRKADRTAYYWRDVEKSRALGRDYYLTHREARLASCRKSRYGLTPDALQAMLLTQANACGFCKRPFKDGFAVDHDHESGNVRALVHLQCNVTIAWAERYFADYMARYPLRLKAVG